MMKAKSCFEAGLILGRLQGAMLLPIGKSDVDFLRRKAESALVKIGLNMGVLNLSNLEGLPNQVQQICDTKESLCFELGLDIPPLQTNLLVASSASSNPNISDNDLSNMILNLKPLIEQIRLNVARIGALKMARPFIGEVEKGLSSLQELKLTSAKLFKEVDIFKAQLEAWMEHQAGLYDVQTKEQKIEVRLGDNATIYGDFVVAHSIQESFNKAASAVVSEKLKGLLKELTIAVGKMTQEMPADYAKEVAEDLEILVEQTSRERPKRRWCTASVEGLEQAAKSIGKVGEPILKLIERIVPFLMKISA